MTWTKRPGGHVWIYQIVSVKVAVYIDYRKLHHCNKARKLLNISHITIASGHFNISQDSLEKMSFIFHTSFLISKYLSKLLIYFRWIHSHFNSHISEICIFRGSFSFYQLTTKDYRLHYIVYIFCLNMEMGG